MSWGFNVKISIRNRLIAAFLAVVFLPIGIMAGYYLLQNFRLMKEPGVDFPKDTREIAAELEKAYEKQGSFSGAGEILQKHKSPAIAQIQLIDNAGQVVADTTPGSGLAVKRYNLTQLAEKLSFPGDKMEADQLGFVKNPNFHLYCGAPVKVKGKPVGLVVVAFSYADIWNVVQGTIFKTVLVGFSAVIVVSLFFAWLISRGITNPLRELVSATRVIAGGDLDSRVRIKARNELGDLGDAFNLMVDNLQQSLAREKALENSRRELIANVSHDLRTPLTSVRGYVEGLRDGIAQNPEKFKRYLDVIYDKTLSLERLIGDLFQLSQLDAGQLEMKSEPVGASELLTGIVNRFVPDAEAQNISLVSQIPVGLPEVLVDRDRIGQALGNIIENSIKYTAPDGTITVKAWANEEGVEVMVADTGEGISQEDLPRVFDRFYRGEKSRSRKSGGTGLGLAIAKQIVEAHNGQLSVESERGLGSKFYIKFKTPVN